MANTICNYYKCDGKSVYKDGYCKEHFEEVLRMIKSSPEFDNIKTEFGNIVITENGVLRVVDGEITNICQVGEIRNYKFYGNAIVLQHIDGLRILDIKDLSDVRLNING